MEDMIDIDALLQEHIKRLRPEIEADGFPTISTCPHCGYKANHLKVQDGRFCRKCECIWIDSLERETLTRINLERAGTKCPKCEY